jgi:hypothetical protein
MALAQSLSAAGGAVLGTTTTPEQLCELEAIGVQPHLLRLGSDFSSSDDGLLQHLLRSADVLVLNVPPRAARPVPTPPCCGPCTGPWPPPASATCCS